MIVGKLGRCASHLQSVQSQSAWVLVAMRLRVLHFGIEMAERMTITYESAFDAMRAVARPGGRSTGVTRG